MQKFNFKFISDLKIKLRSYLESEDLKKIVSEINIPLTVGVLVSSFVLACVSSFIIEKLMYPDLKTSQPINIDSPKIVGGINSLPEDVMNLIYDRNLFNKEGTIGDDTREKEAVISDHVIRSKLKLKVIGIIYGGTPYNGVAIIEDPERKKTNNFSVGDRVLGNVFIEEIHNSQIIVKNNGNLEFLDLVEYTMPQRKRTAKKTQSKKSVEILPGGVLAYYEEEGLVRNGYETTITTAKKDHMLGADLPKVLQDAKASPNIVNGRVNGFILTRIKPDSVYEKAGLLNNDIIDEINGVKLTDAAGAIRLLQSLRNAKNIDISVVRNGNKIPMKLMVQ